MTASPHPDPSRTSHYVSDALYTTLIEQFSGWCVCIEQRYL